MLLRSIVTSAALLLACASTLTAQAPAHVWELQEIALRASGSFANPYAEVECWIELQGPGFSKRVYGFWDGGDVYRVRFVATAPGAWNWTSGSNQPADTGLNGRTGRFTAHDWTEDEKRANPNRRGFLRPDKLGHALQYADGTPFFLLGDTWLGAATWRLPLTDSPADPLYQAAPGVTFQQAVALRKRQGFNSVSMIAAFPTWASDQYPSTYADQKGVYYRNAWEAFGVMTPGDRQTAKAMHDERGYRPFEIVPGSEGLPDYDRIVPAFFGSLDRKMALLADQGFVPMLETIRRDVAPPWKAYYDFNRSFGRFLQYMVARYGAYTMIFSKVHFDIYLPNYSLTADEFNAAITGHYRQYGPMPFGQPVTSLIDHATDLTFGTGERAPWITMHSTGNKPRDHGIYADIERQFRLSPAMPTADLEPHYTGWVHGNNVVNGEQAESGSDRDNYFSRAQMYGCVLSGGLAGHVHGTGAYDVTSAAEPPGTRPYFWQALRYESASYMRGLGTFVLSEGTRYRDLEPAPDDLSTRKAPGSSEQGLDGWSFLMRAPDRQFGLLYFENKAHRGTTTGWKPSSRYVLTWFDTRAGEWLGSVELQSDKTGSINLPLFPGGQAVATADWAAKILIRPPGTIQAPPTSVIASGASLQKLAGGFEFTEGPTSDKAGNVFFTDQPTNRIMRWGVDGTLSTFLQPAGRANGMFFDPQSNLLACADERTELWSVAPDGSHVVLARQFDGKPLNGPNDVWVRKDGALYFTDPFYQRPWWEYLLRPQDSEQVYFLSADRKTMTRVTFDLVRPNGIIGAPDGTTLFVADAGAARTYAYDIQPDGRLTNRRLRCDAGSDGMTLDTEGNLYLTGRGVSVCGPDGRLIEHIDVPEPWTANVAFGGPDHRTLFVTASKGLYAIKLRVAGANATK